MPIGLCSRLQVLGRAFLGRWFVIYELWLADFKASTQPVCAAGWRRREQGTKLLHATAQPAAHSMMMAGEMVALASSLERQRLESALKVTLPK